MKHATASDTSSLFLQVEHGDGHEQSLYISGGVTIGRNSTNDIVVEHADVDRTHAKVDDEEGTLMLRCLKPEGKILLGDRAVREIELRPGVCFQIGTARFECLEISLPASETSTARTECPFCGYADIDGAQNKTVSCPQCHHSLLVISPSSKQKGVVLVPLNYGPGDRYRAERFAAHGGMGTVLQGRDTEREIAVAIKLIFDDEATRDLIARRFQQEVESLKGIRHPNLVRLFCYGRMKGGGYYLVMEWISGRSLRDVIEEARERGESVDYEEALGYLVESCQGLEALHEHGLVHRDIKPSNLLLDADGRLRIADLGISKSIDSERTQGLTVTGLVHGTVNYMAPEQWTAPDNVDQRADQYALGVTIYEMLTGRLPQGAWQPASEINPTVPPAFDSILRAMLAPQPDQRFDNVKSVLEGLEALSKPGSLDSSLPEDETAKSRISMILAAIVVGGLLGICTSFFIADVDTFMAALLGSIIGAIVGGTID